MEIVILIAFDPCTDKTTNKIDTIHVNKDPPRSLLKYSYRATDRTLPLPPNYAAGPGLLNMINQASFLTKLKVSRQE